MVFVQTLAVTSNHHHKNVLYLSEAISLKDPGPEVIKIFMLNPAEHDFFLLINVKMPIIVGIFTFMSRKK